LYDWLGYDSYAAYTARDYDVTPIPTAVEDAQPTADPAVEVTPTEG